MPLQLASLYNFLAGDGKGECIGIIELGGGYQASDLTAYFSGLGVPAPKVVAVGVDQSGNQPSGDPGGPDGEVTLDIEIAGAIAPGATIAVYFTKNSDAGFIDAVNRAVHDTTHKPSVISISWGGPETVWTPQSLQAFNSVLQAAAVMGVTVCAASGDSGSTDGVGDGGDHVDFPASSPYVLACGGTNRRRRGRGRREQCVPCAGMAEGPLCCRHARRQDGARRARRARRGRRCIAGHRLRRADRRHEHRGGRHERGSATVGCAHCAHQRGKGAAGGLHQSEAVRREERLQRHHTGR